MAQPQVAQELGKVHGLGELELPPRKVNLTPPCIGDESPIPKARIPWEVPVGVQGQGVVLAELHTLGEGRVRVLDAQGVPTKVRGVDAHTKGRWGSKVGLEDGVLGVTQAREEGLRGQHLGHCQGGGK